MNPLPIATEVLRRLDPRIRKAIYSVLAVIGAVLAGLVAAGVDDLRWFTVDQALQVYAYLSPLMGVVAVANVGTGDAEATLLDFDEDADASSFEPVGDESEVFAELVH